MLWPHDLGRRVATWRCGVALRYLYYFIYVTPLPSSPVSCIYTHTTVIVVIFWNSMFVKKCHTTCTDSRFIMHNSDLYHLIKHKLLYGTEFFSGPDSQKFNSSSRSGIFMSRTSSLTKVFFIFFWWPIKGNLFNFRWFFFNWKSFIGQHNNVYALHIFCCASDIFL